MMLVSDFIAQIVVMLLFGGARAVGSFRGLTNALAVDLRDRD